MADFNTSVQPVEGSSQPVAPVQGNTQLASGLQAFTNIAGGVAESLFGPRAQQMQARAQKQNENTAVASFYQQQLKVAQAVDQGTISSKEARMRMRANFYSAAANFQGNPQELATAQASIISNAGLGKVVDTGTDEEIAQREFIKKAADAGWVSPSMSESEQTNAAYNYQKFTRAQQDLLAEKSQYELQSAKLGVQRDVLGIQQARQSLATGAINQQNAKLNLYQKQREVASQSAVGQIQDSYNYKFQDDLNGIRQQFEKSNKTPEDIRNAQMAIQNQLANVQQQVAGIGSDAGTSYINNVITPMKMRAENMVDYITGKTDSTILDNRNHNAEAVQKSLLLAEPGVAKFVAATNLYKNTSGSVQMAADKYVLDALNRNGLGSGKAADPLPTTKEEAKQLGGYFDHLRVGMAMHQAGQLSNHDATTEEINNNLNNVLKGISAYSMSSSNPSDYNSVVDFLASPQFGNYSVNESKGLDSAAAASARRIIQQQYENNVLPLVLQEYKTSTTLGGKLNPDGSVPATGFSYGRNPEPTAENVVPTFVGSGVVFNAKDANDIDARSKANDLNKRVAPVVNRLVRMSAHLEGTTDYRGTYEKHYASIFEVHKGGGMKSMSAADFDLEGAKDPNPQADDNVPEQK